jgi:hypothetical protein
LKAPYTFNGSLMHFPEKQWKDDPRTYLDPVWLEAEPLTYTLVLVEMRRGLPAAYFVWRELDSDVTYPMFIADMVDLIKRGSIKAGVVTATWVVSKRGQYYGIKATEVY